MFKLAYNGVNNLNLNACLTDAEGDPSECFTILAQWRKASADWDCLGSNDMNLTLDNTQCQGWPATVTLTPV